MTVDFALFDIKLKKKLRDMHGPEKNLPSRKKFTLPSGAPVTVSTVVHPRAKPGHSCIVNIYNCKVINLKKKIVNYNFQF